jgi:hypothetical protein
MIISAVRAISIGVGTRASRVGIACKWSSMITKSVRAWSA